MVRAGVVNHPAKWKESGFNEIQRPPERYAIIDLESLTELSGLGDLRDFQTAHRQWIEKGLENGMAVRDDHWSESIAVGNRAFIDQVKNELGFRADHREVIEENGSYALREATEAYARSFPTEGEALRSQNTFSWDESSDDTRD